MVALEGWFPPTRENWELAAWAWQFFPIFAVVQLFTDYYPQGKTSTPSRFNLPGKWAWLLMEIWGTIIVLYCFFMIPRTYAPAASFPIIDRHAPTGSPAVTRVNSAWLLPWGNWTMVAMFVLHYSYRAVLAPLLLNPSMAPIHPIVFFAAMAWQVCNGLSIGGWVGGYGPTTVEDWAGRPAWTMLGMIVWGWAWLGNIFHDDELREIRREGLRRKAKGQTEGKDVVVLGKNEPGGGRIYMMPQNGLFKFVLYPHYLCEFIEWGGYWMLGGWNCVPARSFLFNEMATMVLRALSGYRWYERTFGREKIGDRKAIIPYIL